MSFGAFGMTGAVYRQGSLMERSTRRWLTVGALICGSLAVIGWSVVTYAFKSTPQIFEIAITKANGTQVSQNKTEFLFVPVIFQTFIFFAILNPLVRWKRILSRATERAAPNDVWTALVIVDRLSFPKAIQVITIVHCALGIVTLYWTIERAEYVLSNSL